MESEQYFGSARDPLGRNLPAGFSEEFAFLGVKLCFETNSPAILDSCTRSFARNGPPPSGQANFVVRLMADPTLRTTLPWPEPVFRGYKNLFYICLGPQNTAVADVDQGHAVAFLAPEMIEDVCSLRRYFIECLPLTMATHGKAATHSYVHASAVAKGDQGLIISGPAHEGKSSLAYACARHGFNIVADDVVYLRNSGNGLIAWGVPWRLRLTPESANLFPELKTYRDALGQPNDAGILELDTGLISPSCPIPSCKPRALLFLNRSGETCSCRTLDGSEAIKLLARDLIFDAYDVMEKHVESWMQLASRGAYELRYGEDIEAAVDLLEHFLQFHEAGSS